MDATSAIESEGLFRYSDTFNDPTLDPTTEITYQSCDNVQFRIHAIYLKAHSGNLAPPEGTSLQEIVHLTEPASVLEILFNFICPIIQPVLALEVNFEVLRDLAEAAEKYQVFPAMYACHLEMQANLPNHAIFVLGYALKHSYADLVDEAAPLTIEATFPDILRGLPPEFYESWLSYYKAWFNVQQRALSIHSQRNNRRLAMSASELSLYRSLKDNYASQDGQWKSSVQSDVDAIPKMSDMVGCRKESLQNLDERPTSADVIIVESCEGALHYANLDTVRACSKGLAGLQNAVKVPETAGTIGLLFQYLKPARSPDLTALPYDQLRDLTLAAEKYSIYPAMGSCRVMMKRHLPGHEKEAFYYALKNSYFDILDACAPQVLAKTTSFFESTRRLPEPFILPWARYSQAWRDFARDVTREVKSIVMESDFSCNCSERFGGSHVLPILSALVEGSELLANLDDLFPVKPPCYRAQEFFGKCRQRVRRKTQPPPFSSFM